MPYDFLRFRRHLRTKKVGIFKNKVFAHTTVTIQLRELILEVSVAVPPQLTTHTNKQTLDTSARHWQNCTLSFAYAITVNGPQYRQQGITSVEHKMNACMGI